MLMSPPVWKPCMVFTSKIKSGICSPVFEPSNNNCEENPFHVTLLQPNQQKHSYNYRLWLLFYLITPFCTFSTSWFISAGTSQIKVSKIFVILAHEGVVGLVMPAGSSKLNCLLSQCLSSTSVIWTLISTLTYANIRPYLISLIKKKCQYFLQSGKKIKAINSARIF